MTSDSAPKYDWPRKYLLDIYAAAVREGHIIITPVTEDQAVSLRLAIYRQRRRSQGSNAHLVDQRYHLVTVGHWVPDPATPGMGHLPVLYNSRPEGLPSLRRADDFELIDTDSEPNPSALASERNLVWDSTVNPNLDLEDVDVERFLTRLSSKVRDDD